jgi:hypothetical protein
VDSKNGLPSEVYLDEYGFIHFTYREKLNETSGLRLVDDALQLAGQLHQQGKSIKVLADVRNLEGYTPTVSNSSEIATKVIPFTKMAIVVRDMDSTITATLRAITEQSDSRKRIRYFPTIAQALHWLND